MKFKNPVLVVDDINAAREFYGRLLGLRVIRDLRERVILTGGVELQTKSFWLRSIGRSAAAIQYYGNDASLYFEEKEFDGFLAKLEAYPGLDYVHRAVEYEWGQRIVRFYDLDGHIIGVGEDMKMVCKRFLKQGFTVEEIAKRTHSPSAFIRSCEK